MAEDYKPVNDRTINDVNRANRDAWDSGEFRHGDAWPKGARKASEMGAAAAPQPHGPLTRAQQEYANKAGKEKVSEYASEEFRERMGRRSAIMHHPENDSAAKDFLTHPGGAGAEAPRLHSQREERETGDAVHLPRRASRQWRKRTWE